MLSYNELKPGTYIVLEGRPYIVLEYSFMRMQMRKPAVQTKIKDLTSGKVISRSFHPQDTIEEADILRKKVKFLYNSRGEFWFCEENDPGVRFKLEQEIIGDAADLMKPNLIVDALAFGEKIINIDLPIKVDLKVVEAPPSFKGDTASGGSKQVKLETGAIINVPFFINQGDIVRVNTHDRSYVERASKTK
jgi:elongation factor P